MAVRENHVRRACVYRDRYSSTLISSSKVFHANSNLGVRTKDAIGDPWYIETLYMHEDALHI